MALKDRRVPLVPRMRQRRLPFGGRPWTWAALLTAVCAGGGGCARGAVGALGRPSRAPGGTRLVDGGVRPRYGACAHRACARRARGHRAPWTEPPQAEVPPESVPEPESPIVDEPWPTYGYDVARSHVAPPSADHRPPYSRLWAVRSGGNIELPPTVAYGRVYLAEGRGRFFSIDAESGDVVWEKHFSETARLPRQPSTKASSSSPTRQRLAATAHATRPGSSSQWTPQAARSAALSRIERVDPARRRRHALRGILGGPAVCPQRADGQAEVGIRRRPRN